MDHLPCELSSLESKHFAADLLAGLREAEDEAEGEAAFLSEEQEHRLGELACEVVNSLCENEASCLAQGAAARKQRREGEEETCLDKCFTVVKHFASLDAGSKTRLADCLGSNLSVLNAQCDAACAEAKRQGAGDNSDDVRLLRAALKLHVAFLQSILSHATAYGRKHGGSSAGGAHGGKKKRAGSGSGWEWMFVLEKTLRPLACAAGLDLQTLYTVSGSPATAQTELLDAFSACALTVLNCANALSGGAGAGSKGSSVKESLMRLIAVASHKLMAMDQAAMPVAAAIAGEDAPEEDEAKDEEEEEEEEEKGEEDAPAPAEQVESKLAALLPAFVDAVNKCEQAGTVLVDASAYCAQALSNAKLGKGLVTELAKVDPRDYRAQQQSDAQGVKNVAAFFVDMAERLPQVMAACLSVVVPHLGGEAYTLRSGIVMVIARILVHHSESGSNAATHAPTGGSEGFLKSKQHLLKVLVERIFDVSAFTRSKTLQSWAYLCQHKAIPIGYWNYICEIAMGRLEDKAALVRKSALQLLSTMLQ